MVEEAAEAAEALVAAAAAVVSAEVDEVLERARHLKVHPLVSKVWSKDSKY